MARIIILSIFLLFPLNFIFSEGAKGYGPGEQDWGFLDVREGAHMFYWLYYTTANVSSYTQRPLAVWLIGGPGSSSVGFGNFEEIGPMTLEEEMRDYTWVKDMNVLFIDSPIGSGFSYTDNENLYTTNNTEMAWDFVSFLKAFYEKHQEFETVPLHLFGESYGGKMIAEVALELHKSIKRGELNITFKSVIMMSPWLAPTEVPLAWAPYLFSTSALDKDGYLKLMSNVNEYVNLWSEKKYEEAYYLYGLLYNNISILTKGTDIFNLQKKSLTVSSLSELGPDEHPPMELFEDRDKKLADFMNEKVAPALNINKTWGEDVMIKKSLSADILKPIVNILVQLLETTDLEVALVAGQVDVLCNPIGFTNFMKNINWSYKADYDAAPREGVSVNGILEGYKKSAGKFSFFWINRGGHMLVRDNPAAVDHILKYYTKYEDVSFTPSFL